MKKFMNTAETLLAESMRGFATAHADIVALHESPVFVTRAGSPRRGKVALISGGGSGHEPRHAGVGGRGLLVAACRSGMPHAVTAIPGDGDFSWRIGKTRPLAGRSRANVATSGTDRFPFGASAQ